MNRLIHDDGNMKAIVSIPGWAVDMMEGNGQGRSASTPVGAYASVPLLYRAVNLRCQSLSSVPYVVFKGENETEWPMKVALEEIIFKAELSMMLYGVAYVLKTRKGRMLTGLQWLNPKTVTWEYKHGQNVFTQKINDVTYGPWGDEDMLVLREPSIETDIGPGLAPAQVALQAARLRFNIDEFAAAFFEHGAQPMTLLTTSGNPKESEIARTESFFKRTTGGVKNAWKTLFLRGEIKVEKLTPDLKTMEMPALAQHVVLDIGAALGVPRSLLESDAANYATSQTDMESFWTMTIRPRLPMFEMAINEQVFGDSVEDYSIRFTPENLDVFQADEAARSASLLQLVSAGVPLQQAMDMLGYDPLDNNPEAPQSGNVATDEESEMRSWQKYAIRRLDKKDQRPFEARHIGLKKAAAIEAELKSARTPDAVKAVFDDHRAVKIQPADIEAILRGVDVDIVEENLLPITHSVIASFGGEALTEVLHRARLDMIPFEPNNVRTQAYLREKFGQRIKDITETTRQEIGASLAESIAAGEDVRRMENRIRDKFKDISRARARTIAVTETGGAANHAITEGYRQSGIVQKRKWVTAFLNSRDVHERLNGQIVNMNDPFTMDGMSAMEPGEFGIAEQDINCHCRTVAASFTISEN